MSHPRRPRCLTLVGSALLLAACANTGVNPTGLAGGQVQCAEGPRQTLDCRGALQQFARDLKADVSALSRIQVGVGVTTAKLTEADAITTDLIQHYYQTCTLYNACLLTREQYVARRSSSSSWRAAGRPRRRALPWTPWPSLRASGSPRGSGPPCAGPSPARGRRDRGARRTGHPRTMSAGGMVALAPAAMARWKAAPTSRT